jgi:hypothetical protein
MKINSVTNSIASVELSSGEVGILNNALNEVCNGINLEGEFDTRMGCAVEDARHLLAEVNRLARSLDNSNSAAPRAGAGQV